MITTLISLKNLSNYEHAYSELILTGDTNINLLKVNEKEKCGEFFDILTSFSLYPKITLPTSFSQSHGTLIDNIFCKISNKTRLYIWNNYQTIFRSSSMLYMHKQYAQQEENTKIYKYNTANTRSNG